MTALLGAALLVAASWCQDARITGYVRTDYSTRTYDGTHILTDEPIAAASWNIPIDSMVSIDGYGTVRIADRGALGSRGWIDIAVWSRSEAFALTSTRRICVSPPGG
jgi:3D (Asp-Asp-Asp) domain-containing protein